MRLFIADADSVSRVSLQLVLHKEPGLVAIGMAVRGQGLLAQVEASEPDVLVLDWYLPGPPVTDLIADLRALAFPPRIVVLSVRAEDQPEAMTAGADAFIAKSGLPDELLVYLRAGTLRK